MGDGGGCDSSNGEDTADVLMEPGEPGVAKGSDERCLEYRDDLPDRTVSESDLSPSPLESSAELRGLSFLAEPGILERKVLNDLVESLVSDLLKDGSDCRPSGPATLPGLEEPLPSLDG